MKKKIFSTIALGAIVLSTQAFAFGGWGASSDSSFRENLKQQIKKELNSNQFIQKTRSITPVATKTKLMEQTQQAVSGGVATSSTVATSSQTATLSSESSKQQVAAIGETTKIFGGNATVSSAAVTSTIKLASGGSAGASGSAGKYPVSAVCGAKNFDDVVKATYGAISLERAYIDSAGKTCILGKRTLYVKTLPYTVLGRYAWSARIKITRWVNTGITKKYILRTVRDGFIKRRVHSNLFVNGFCDIESSDKNSFLYVTDVTPCSSFVCTSVPYRKTFLPYNFQKKWNETKFLLPYYTRYGLVKKKYMASGKLTIMIPTSDLWFK